VKIEIKIGTETEKGARKGEIKIGLETEKGAKKGEIKNGTETEKEAKRGESGIGTKKATILSTNKVRTHPIRQEEAITTGILASGQGAQVQPGEIMSKETIHQDGGAQALGEETAQDGCQRKTTKLIKNSRNSRDFRIFREGRNQAGIFVQPKNKSLQNIR